MRPKFLGLISETIWSLRQQIFFVLVPFHVFEKLNTLKAFENKVILIWSNANTILKINKTFVFSNA